MWPNAAYPEGSFSSSHPSTGYYRRWDCLGGGGHQSHDWRWPAAHELFHPRSAISTTCSQTDGQASVDSNLGRQSSMTITQSDYARVFSRLCHLTALSQAGKTDAVIDSMVATVFAIDPRLTPTNSKEITEAVRAYFGLSLPSTEI